jgi:hypothetical protein
MILKLVLVHPAPEVVAAVKVAAREVYGAGR